VRRAARAEADEPVAAILGRAEHGIGAAEGAEGRGDVGGRDARDVAAHDHHAAVAPHGAGHPLAEIAAPLPQDRHRARPAGAGAIRRGGDGGGPAPVAHHHPQQRRQLPAIEAQRRHGADAARQAPLDGAEPWRPREDHQLVAPHPPPLPA
jgi:hypothetical protein